MAVPYNQNGNVYLDGDNFDLKIDVNRIVYFKRKDEDTYTSAGIEVPRGYKLADKEKYLHIFYEKLRDKERQKFLKDVE